MANTDTITKEKAKEIITKKIDYIIWKREQMYKNKNKRQLIPLFERLKEDLIFMIDNPDHKPKEKDE